MEVDVKTTCSEAYSWDLDAGFGGGCGFDLRGWHVCLDWLSVCVCSLTDLLFTVYSFVNLIHLCYYYQLPLYPWSKCVHSYRLSMFILHVWRTATMRVTAGHVYTHRERKAREHVSDRAFDLSLSHAACVSVDVHAHVHCRCEVLVWVKLHGWPLIH